MKKKIKSNTNCKKQKSKNKQTVFLAVVKSIGCDITKCKRKPTVKKKENSIEIRKIRVKTKILL